MRKKSVLILGGASVGTLAKATIVAALGKQEINVFENVEALKSPIKSFSEQTKPSIPAKPYLITRNTQPLNNPFIDPNEPVFNGKKHRETCDRNRKKRKKRKKKNK